MIARDIPDLNSLEQAADWMMKLQEGPLGTDELQSFRQWQLQHPEAWRRAEKLLVTLSDVPAGVGLPTLGRRQVNHSRRALLIALGVAPLAWWGTQRLPSSALLADQRAGVGEQRRITLVENALVHLNTRTALDIKGQQLTLREGEIQLIAERAQPFVMQTLHGRVWAHQARVNIRQFAQHTQVMLASGEARIFPAQGAPATLIAGQSLNFGTRGAEAISPLEPDRMSWITGMLLADSMPLNELLTELTRYRHGRLRASPQITELPVSGAFPLSDTDKALTMLVETYGLEMQVGAFGLWIRFDQAPSA